MEGKDALSKQVDLILYNGGDIINIELNNSFTPNLKERNIVYACNMHGGQLKYKDNSYRNIKSTLQINLNTSDRPYTEELVESYYLYDPKTETCFTKKLQIDVINLQNYNKECYNQREEKLARWSKMFLAKTYEELNKAIGEDLMDNSVKKKLVNEVERCSEDREFIELYSMYSKEELEWNTILEDEKEYAREQGLTEGLEQGLEQGLQQGIEKGIKQGLEQGLEQGINQTKEELRKILIENGMDKEKINQIIDNYKK